MNFFKKILIKPKTLLLIFIAVAVLVITSALYEINESKKQMLSLMSNEAHSLLETIIVSSQEVLYTSGEVEKEINQRLINNANVIKILLERNNVTNSLLERIAKENDINRINIFNNKGEKIYQSFSDEIHAPVTSKYIKTQLNPIFNNETDTLLIGIKKARMENSYRYVVALATNTNGAIVLNLEAEELLKFKKRIGFGVLIKRLTDNKDVLFAALEDSTGILAASGNIEYIESIGDSEFLINSFADSTFNWRISETNDVDLFEAVHPFEIEGTKVGLYRIGLSLEPLEAINDRVARRILVIGIILFVFGSIIISLIFMRQNFDVLKKQFQSVESYSNKLIQSVSDAIVVVDCSKKIKEFNFAAEKLFGLDGKSKIGVEINSITNSENCIDLFSDEPIKQYECEIKNKKRFLLVSISEFFDKGDNKNFVLIIKDLTEIRDLEKQIARSEQLKAMGELASGVAHEIRNPLNTIGTIVQQLDKDFSPEKNKEEYHSLSKLVYKEVRRINETIENFLRFSKPEPINRNRFRIGELIKDLKTQYNGLLKEKSISLNITQNWDGEVNWDKNQFKQVLMNLIQNSAEAIDGSGNISLTIDFENSNVDIAVTDDGMGMSEENVERIFNLYYTTKASGTGIGLSIIQRIVHEHNGAITVDSEEGKGTSFKIKIPSA